MSSNIGVRVFGIKISLNASYTQDTSIGLYTSGGKSFFQWIQNDYTGLTGWKSGMIIPEGVMDYSKSIDLKNGGNISSPGSAGVTIVNTVQFWKTISDAGIVVTGSLFEVYLFAGSTTPEVQWRGVCDQPEWDTKTYTIRAFGLQQSRKAYLGTLIDDKNYPNASEDEIGDCIPVSFGTNPKTRFIQTEDNETSLTFERTMDFNDGLQLLNSGSNDRFGDSIFPIISNDGSTPPRVYTFKLVMDTTGASYWYKNLIAPPVGDNSLTSLVGKFVHVVSGTGAGAYRYIESASVNIDASKTGDDIKVTVADYFEETLAGNSTAKDPNQSWIEIVDIAKSYAADKWPLKDMLDKDGNSVSSGFDVYSFDKNQKTKITVSALDEETTGKVIDQKDSFYNIPSYAFSKIAGSSDNNAVDIDLKQFEGDTDSVNGFSIYPVRDFKKYDQPTLSVFDKDGNDTFHNYQKIIDGVYTYLGAFHTLGWSTAETGSVDNIYDADRTTSYKLSAGYAYNSNPDHYIPQFCVCAEFKLPEISDELSFDEVYVIVDIKTHMDIDLDDYLSSGEECSIHLRSCRLMGYATEIIPSATGEAYNDNDGGISHGHFTSYGYVKCVPDDYYGSIIDNNLSFYNENVQADNPTILHGYKRFLISGIDSVKKYRALKKCLIVLQRKVITYQVYESSMEIYDIAVAFRKKLSINDAIYVSTNGRKWNSTLGARGKTSGAMITSAVDVLEHVSRLQKWDDVGDSVPALGWGKDYSSGALIKTSGDGSFDSGIETPATLLNAMDQIFDYDKTATEDIKKSICKTFWLANYYDRSGYECIKQLSITTASPTDTITYAMIAPEDRSKIKIIEAQAQDIYCEPVVNYDKNFGNGEYKKSIKITNASAASYNSSYVIGLSPTLAETYWTRCHALWSKVKTIISPPSDMTDIDFANGADADAIAQNYLTKWIDFMSVPRIELVVPFDVVCWDGSSSMRPWEEGHRFYANLPNHTNGNNLECILESISINACAPYKCKLKALMIGSAAAYPEDYLIQDVLGVLTGDNAWQDVLADGSEKNIQDII